MARARTKAEQATRKATVKSRTLALRGKETSTMAAAAAVPVDKPLSDKQKRYVAARARGESIPNAMAAAGYNEQPSYGYRMEKMPNIRAAIQAEQALYAEAAQIDRKKVIDMHLEAFEMARLMAEPATMVSAAREIGKICGHYETKINVHHTGNVQHEIHRFESMTDEQLLEFLASRAAASAAQNQPDESAPALEYDDEQQ